MVGDIGTLGADFRGILNWLFSRADIRDQQAVVRSLSEAIFDLCAFRKLLVDVSIRNLVLPPVYRDDGILVAFLQSSLLNILNDPDRGVHL